MAVTDARQDVDCGRRPAAKCAMTVQALCTRMQASRRPAPQTDAKGELLTVTEVSLTVMAKRGDVDGARRDAPERRLAVLAYCHNGGTLAGREGA